MPIENLQENARAREALIRELRKGRLFGVTGAGLSVWAGYPVWSRLIQNLAAEVRRFTRGAVDPEREIQNNPDLLHCAQRLGNYLGPQFGDFIRSQFGPTGQAPHNVLFRFASLPLRHVLTLNFDVSLESAHVPFALRCETISSSNSVRMSWFLREMDDPDCPKQVVHLHGTYEDLPENMALTELGYTKLYKDALFGHFLWLAAAAKRLLFAGFGFADNDFNHALRDCARDVRGNGMNHFAIVGVKPDEHDDAIRNHLNDSYLIEPVFYPIRILDNGTEDHSGFIELINGIADELRLPPVVAAPAAEIRPHPIDPDDVRRADQLTNQLVNRLDQGGDNVQG